MVIMLQQKIKFLKHIPQVCFLFFLTVRGLIEHVILEVFNVILALLYFNFAERFRLRHIALIFIIMIPNCLHLYRLLIQNKLFIEKPPFYILFAGVFTFTVLFAMPLSVFWLKFY